jgi:hypothetical protein
MATTRIRRPRDPFQLAKLIGDIATGQVSDKVDDGKNPAAVALGKLGGAKGGKARANKLSAQRRKGIAKKAAQVRWKKRK